MTLLAVGVATIVVPGLAILVGLVVLAIHDAVRGPDRAGALGALASLYLLFAAIVAIVLIVGAATR